MGKRTDLHKIFVALLGSDKVYHQPPASVKMVYPCIIYRRSRVDTKRANDTVYNNTIGYTVTVIDPDPDSLIPGKILTLPLCSFDRHFTADNLNHDVFNLYY